MAASPTPDDDPALDAPPPVEGERIEGHVTDFDGHPLVGVRVEAAATGGGDLDLLPTMTDGEGAFCLEGLGQGQYDLRFEIGRVAARTLGVPAGTRDLAVRLARPQGVLLLVKTASGAEPPAAIQVVLERQTAGGRRREYAGRHLQSRLLFWSIRPGTYRAVVWGGAYLPVVVEGVEVEEGTPAPEVQVLLGALGSAIDGTVRVGDGADVSRVRVVWRRLDGDNPWPRDRRSTLCGEGGVFAVRGLPPGRYRLGAGSPEGPVADVEIDLAEGATVPVTIDLAG